MNAQLSVKKEKELTEYLQSGFNYLKTNQTKEAVQQYKKALKIDPSNYNAYYNLGLIYAKTKQFDEALAIADEALLKCSEDSGSLYILKANCLSDMGRYEEALPLFLKDLQSASGDSSKVNYNLGYTYAKLKDYQNALIYLKRFIEVESIKGSNCNDAYFYVGTCYMELNDYSVAVDYFDLALIDSKFYSYYYNKAEALSKLKRNDEAIAVISEGIINNPNKEVLYHKRYQIYRELKQKDKSFEDLKKAYSINPNEGDVLFDMGSYYSEDNRMDDAIKCYHKCISLNNNLTGAYNNLANIYKENKLKSDSAEFYYKKAIEILPSEASFYYNFASYYKNIGKYDEAIKLYKKTVELNPNLSSAYKNMGIVYSLMKETDEAIKSVHEALKIDSDDGNNALLASLYFDKLDYENTIVYATKALRIDKKRISTNEVLNMRAVSRQILGDYKNALYDYLEIFSSYNPAEKKEAASILSNIGYCYLEDNQLQNSLKYFSESVNSSSEIDQLIGLFTVQYLLNNKEAFKVTLSKAIAVEPKLKQGFKGIEMLESDGYFYTEKHKKTLKKILMF
ncbi:tetratricopeptide repeat protein [Flavobacterium psychroterrae]|uniref:Tetratricopeptide repeat protein n=1 Tax=Flavobacterium psychroterrae TaxID=2133767 RepID=A0ABS5P709_9FLAO|nr:tetratricopeptide repeat protein [Flavobacterium psychroterrae]MBS7230074.1 tetratricopeptide repeat protein [Flavobacterium psychroterrae]